MEQEATEETEPIQKTLMADLLNHTLCYLCFLLFNGGGFAKKRPRGPRAIVATPVG
jgi:hypothetical protein